MLPAAAAEPASPSRPQPFGKLRFLFDRDDGPADRLVSRWLFLRLLGAVYFSAFFALVFQVLGLLGSGGVLPAQGFLDEVRSLGNHLYLVPSLLWMVHGKPQHFDHWLTAMVWIGLLASVLVIANVLPRPALVVCFLAYLSFVAVSQDFGQYQSDGMLLEAGFLALFVAPAGVLPGWGRRSLASRAALFLLLWEWFRIYFGSGVVKLISGDPTWRNLTAMYEYYQNGPLPTWVGWYLGHLPHWFQRATAGATLLMELLLVFLAFLPRRWRIACFWIVTAWQAVVIATANYAFLNYLVLFLGVLLLDDRYLLRFVPQRFRAGLTPGTPNTLAHEPAPPSVRPSVPLSRSARRHPREVVRAVRIAVTTVLLTAIAYATTQPLVAMLWRTVPLPDTPVAMLEPFRIANTFGLFATMTPHRYEIEFQGSADNLHWTPYPFRYKPQALGDRPRIYAPYQPRFDWNLWFASLTDWRHAPIVAATEIRLLEGSRQTLGLFARNPFRTQPPRYVRAVLFQYWFSTAADHRKTGDWWRRELLGTYAPTLTRTADGSFGAVALPTLNGPPSN